jgi:RimJ/RimL family protein N-acetyltransferase
MRPVGNMKAHCALSALYASILILRPEASHSASRWWRSRGAVERHSNLALLTDFFGASRLTPSQRNDGFAPEFTRTGRLKRSLARPLLLLVAQKSDPEFVKDWKPCGAPALPMTKRRFVQISPLDPKEDGDDLFDSLAGAANDELWKYIPFGPPASAEEFLATMNAMAGSKGWQTLVIREANSGEKLGMASYMRIRPEAGSAEVGCVIFSKALQKTGAATEAIFILARHLFDDLGYRRFE